MFLGLERERSQKSAGIRTFALVSLLAAVFTVTSALCGLVASAGGTTFAVLLYRSGAIDETTVTSLSCSPPRPPSSSRPR